MAIFVCYTGFSFDTGNVVMDDIHRIIKDFLRNYGD